MDAGARQVGWGRREEGAGGGTSKRDGEGAMSLWCHLVDGEDRARDSLR